MKKHILGSLLLATVVGCQQQSAQVGTALLRSEDGTAHEVTYQVEEGFAVTDGDILLGTVDQVNRMNQSADGQTTAVAHTGWFGKWPGRVVPYKIDPSLPNPKRVLDAIAHWEAKTSIRFKPADWRNFNHVVFTTGNSNCSSALGKMFIGAQYVRLSDGCDVGSIVHEIGHAVGLAHEQSRGDRDDYITIHWENIEKGSASQFWKAGWFSQDIGSYDFDSIMHYSPYSFSKNGKPTITRKDGRTDFGHANELSPKDIAAVEELYR